ncbi:hypothetical protein LRB11_17315, partial [Ectothiorhodospira haloalkaliphila]|uniref:hypothetical protein n=1 Tax=Ectothiorhodospira haloalkaliphila TaxID=421628 RepID=UPI001EE94D89
EDDLTVTMGSAILDIDSNGDGEKDTQITLQGDFENAVFNVDQSDLGSIVTYYLSQEAPSIEAAEYARLFIEALAGDGVEVNAALVGTFSQVLGRMLVEGDDGHWEPTPVFDTLAPVFTFVVTGSGDRPVSPFAYTNEAKQAAHAAARGEGGDTESVMLEWDENGVLG